MTVATLGRCNTQLSAICVTVLREAARRGIVAQVSGATIWRWLDSRGDSALAASQLDFSPGRAVRREGRTGAGSLPRLLAGPSLGQ